MPFKIALNFSDGRTYFIDAEANETVVDAALRHGIMLPVDCREGVCGTCRGTCVSGTYQQQYVHPDALGKADLDSGAILSCQMFAKDNCVINFDIESAMVGRRAPESYPTVVRQITQVSNSVTILDLELAADARFDYLPGQYVHLKIPGTSVRRSYSFATAPQSDGRLHFVIRILPRGEMSNYLRTRARPGDIIHLEGPYGVFYLRRITRPVLFVAGGTGISAFLGMLDALAIGGNPGYPVTLLYGVTHDADFCDIDRLQKFAETLPGFQYRTIAMEPSAAWTGPRGVVTDLIGDDDLHAGNVDMYICGPPPMVDAVHTLIRQKELASARIYTEKFAAS